MPLATPSWSSLHMSKTPRHPQPSSTPAKLRLPPQPPLLPSMMLPNDPSHLSSSRSSSLAGKKRPRESDGDTKARLARRTNSVGDARVGRTKSRDRDREAFQRGLIAVFVPNALKDSLVGELEHYNDLLARFLPSPTTPTPALQPLLPLLRALTAQVSLLSPEIHGSLITAIFGLQWAAGEEKFVNVFVGFAGVLVSSQPGWAKEVVNMAVRGLLWQPKLECKTSLPISRRIYHARQHLLLAHLLSLIPTLPTVIQPLLARHFPNKREPEVAQTTWMRNCCELIGYCPELGQRVWGQIVDRMLRIDVEINNILDEEEDDDDDEEDEAEPPLGLSSSSPLDPFDLSITDDVPRPEPLSPEGSDDSGSEIDPDELSSVDGEASEEDEAAVNEAKAAKERIKRLATVKSMREKLDGMLFYFFAHLEECMGGRPVSTPAAEIAAANLLTTTTNSSGASTPTSEFANAMSSSIPSLASTRPPPTPAQSLAHFQILLNLFTRQILPTSSTQHIPFLVFLTSSLSPSHTDLFLGLLVSQALYGTSTTGPSPASQPVSISQRVASTVYIGSVVCRARFVTDEQARQVMTYLLAYIDGKMHTQPRLDEPQLFYAVCQAVMLIFCFRWRAFTVDKDESVLGEMEMDGDSVEGDGKWMRDLDVLQKVITSDLNPLLGCNSTIVSTFAKIAHQTNFAYCFSIIEANQQSAHPSRSSNGNSLPTTPHSAHPSRQNSVSSLQPTHALPRSARQSNIDSGYDSYFPFDPYALPRSKKFFEGLYRTWGDVAIDNGDSDDEDDEDGEGGENVTEEESMDESVLGENFGHGRSSARSLPKLGAKSGSYSDRRRRLFDKDGGLSSSLEGMSISPGLPRVMGSLNMPSPYPTSGQQRERSIYVVDA